MNYYNEFDDKTAQWLRNLIDGGQIPQGHVDSRSITEVEPDELKRYTQCHFFAGIGGWSYALQLAGWEPTRPVWTGSCPCQPFSTAGKQKGKEDERHLWPVWFNLIRECRPPVVFGEQVASAITHGWLDEVANDLEGEGYAFGSAIIPACSVGAPHKRDRLWFVASHNWSERRKGFRKNEVQGREGFSWCKNVGRVEDLRGRPDIPEPIVRSLSDGFPSGLGYGILHGFGNAIVPQVAAKFIESYMESLK